MIEIVPVAEFLIPLKVQTPVVTEFVPKVIECGELVPIVLSLIVKLPVAPVLKIPLKAYPDAAKPVVVIPLILLFCRVILFVVVAEIPLIIGTVVPEADKF